MVIASAFENRIDLEIIEICFYLPDAFRSFKAVRTPAKTNMSARPYINCIWLKSGIPSFKLFVGPDLGPNFLLMLSAEVRW